MPPVPVLAPPVPPVVVAPPEPVGPPGPVVVGEPVVPEPVVVDAEEPPAPAVVGPLVLPVSPPHASAPREAHPPPTRRARRRQWLAFMIASSCEVRKAVGAEAPIALVTRARAGRSDLLEKRACFLAC